MPATASPYLRSSETAPGRKPEARNVGAELDNIFKLARQDRGAPAPSRLELASESRRVTQTDLDAALDMLNRAARAMDMLQSRYLEVEAYARDVADRAERDLSQAHGEARQWEARATAGETLAEDMKARLATVERRLEQAERRAELAERRADYAERGAHEAREWLEDFYGKVVTACETRPFQQAA